jgi:hypothetical protein
MTEESGQCTSGTEHYGGVEVTDGVAEEIYRIECLDCGAVQIGDTGDNIDWDKRYHRMHHCPDADFEVEPA